ncbi:MAG: transposase [Gammaproteobacteria bacterium]|nr:transposase [Gammaproteobacteria bacterium]
MARLPRYTIINQPQNIILPVKNGTSAFREDQDYQYFHDCLDAAAYNYRLKVHAFALTPGEVFLLASPGQADSVSRTMQSIGRNYVQYFNESYNGSGTLWQGRYRATVIDERQYLLACSRFVETAPVRAGLVKGPRAWRWSSYAHNARGKIDPMITPHREYLRLGKSSAERADAYRALIKQKLDPVIVADIHEKTRKGWAIGDSKFIRRIEKLGGRRAVQLPKGRPRGS